MTVVQPDHEALRAHYEREWSEGETAFADGTFLPDPVPCDGVPRFGLSFVVRLESPFADLIAAESDAIAKQCRGSHLNYVQRDLHMTVRSVEGYQDTVPQHQIDHYRGQFKQAAEDLGPIQARFQGLGGSRGGLYIRGFPNAALLELRRRLRDARMPFGNLGPAGGDGDRYRDNAHISLLVPREPVPEPDVAAYVAARTNLDFGSVTCTEVSLVRWRPDLHAANIEEIERISW
ncbi:2'-5' RNA ligase family protein [Glycomyces sp. MUSA5-2]|uniref:2'-5' RNA ligase family protein n=1 Tax=Glycomyces sp. MUSA5-2 TaxID=2053002 RepID=UPI003009F8B0